mgnify:FL=1
MISISKNIEVKSRVIVIIAAICVIFINSAFADTSNNNINKKVAIGVIGMAGGAVDAMKHYQDELNVSISALKPERFRQKKLPDLSKYDLIITSFTSSQLKKQYRQAVTEAKKKNPQQKLVCVGPGVICNQWAEWVGQQNIIRDPQMAAYYGLSHEAMREMLRYALITWFNHKGDIVPPPTDKIVRIWHPQYGNFETIDEFLNQAKKAGWNLKDSPRVALGTWRHHVLFHQPRVIEALINELQKQGILAVSIVADAQKFREKLEKFKPDLVIMNSHTREPPDFWKKLDVPRLHALWFTEESIDEWRKSNQTGMSKSQQFHQIVSAEMKGGAETLTAGGTETGHDSGEEIIPIPDRIRLIAKRAKRWINLRHKPNKDKKIALVIYDREADKAGLMSGPAHNLNAPRSMVKFLKKMKNAGYTVENNPIDSDDLINKIMNHGRQMGNWEPAEIERLARSGKAALIPEKLYRQWFEEYIPQWRRNEVLEQWGEIPGKIMVWEDNGKKYIVLPKLDMGNITLFPQPLKGETLTASMKVQDTRESLLPPTHHYLASYFWLRNGLKADALVHFGTHGSEWLYEGKMAVMSRADWSEIFLGDLPNINPWLTSNTSELLPSKRRAHAVHVGFIPPPLMDAGLSDELINLETDIHRFQQLGVGFLKKKFAKSVTEQAIATGVDKDLNLNLKPNEIMSEYQIEQLSLHLHDLMNAQVPSGMHVLGEPPSDELIVPYLVSSLGKRFLESLKELYDEEEKDMDIFFQKKKGRAILKYILVDGLNFERAIEESDGKVPDAGLPTALAEGLELAVEMHKGLKQTHSEIDNVLAALEGKFIPPGPSGNPERNMAVVPGGRNLYILNPEELPSKASWDLGKKLINRHLAKEFSDKGKYPRKIGFSLIPFATYSDFGIIESQILYLMGVRPIWDAKNRVRDVELIPTEKLKRPRIDVFLSARSVYRDELPGMMKLIDKAIRLAASVNEPDNYVYQHSEATRKKLESEGISNQRALALSKARMFGAKPEEILDGHNWFFYLTERSGEWENKEELVDLFLKYNKHVYTEGIWGENAPEVFDDALAGTETIMRSWYDNRDFVLKNKFAWWVDGTLSLAIKQQTGKEPQLLFVDVRNPDEATFIDSTTAARQDLLIRVVNPKWIKSMMKEGYAGGNTMAKNLDNMMGWEIMREQTFSDQNWNHVADTYVKDKHDINIREWFDKTNPHAFQKLTVTMLETIRKGYWKADKATQLEIATAYAESVAKHGRASGVREGGNDKLVKFVDDTLSAEKSSTLDSVLKEYHQRSAELTDIAPGNSSNETVHGKKLKKKNQQQTQNHQDEKKSLNNNMILILVIACSLLIIVIGFFSRHRK